MPPSQGKAAGTLHQHIPPFRWTGATPTAVRTLRSILGKPLPQLQHLFGETPGTLLTPVNPSFDLSQAGAEPNVISLDPNP